MNLSDVQQKAVLILGFGIEGQSTYRFLRRCFPGKEIAVADRHLPKEQKLQDATQSMIDYDNNVIDKRGPNYLSSLSDYDLVIKAPGLPAGTPEIKAYELQGGLLTSHMEIFLSLAKRDHVIGITGTKGKSTTTSLLHRMLRDGGIDAILVGNIGSPPLDYLDGLQYDDRWWVLELSSYQLSGLSRSPHMAILLGIVPEHIGLHDPSISFPHHEDFQSYVAAKATITRYQSSSDILIFNADNVVSSEIARASLAHQLPISRAMRFSNGSFVEGEQLIYARNAVEHPIASTGSIQLLGKFNQINVLAAMTAALQIGVARDSICKTINSFHGLPHRIEFVCELSGVRYYDDSISTVPEATINAIEALGGRVSSIILGGHDRGVDFSTLAESLIARNIQHLILFAPSGLRIWEGVQKLSHSRDGAPIAHFVKSMKEAIEIARTVTRPGETCLLSPASPSYGGFKNFEERGDLFHQILTAYHSAGDKQSAHSHSVPN